MHVESSLLAAANLSKEHALAGRSLRVIALYINKYIINNTMLTTFHGGADYLPCARSLSMNISELHTDVIGPILMVKKTT